MTDVVMTQGEIADKLTICELKLAHGLDCDIQGLTENCMVKNEDIDELRMINTAHWEEVETIHEAFDIPGSVSDDELLLAFKHSHTLNRQRIAVKNRINAAFGQSQEEKTWKRSTI